MVTYVCHIFEHVCDVHGHYRLFLDHHFNGPAVCDPGEMDLNNRLTDKSENKFKTAGRCCNTFSVFI